MRKWKLKAFTQRILSSMPGGVFLNTCCQRFITKGLVLTPRMFEIKLRQAQTHLDHAKPVAGRLGSDFTVLDLGTGWFPIVPVAMYLCGASKVWTVDIAPLLAPVRCRKVFEFFVEYARSGRLVELLPYADRERVGLLAEVGLSMSRRHTVPEMLAHANVEWVVGDVRSASLEPYSVDLFVSNCVLEHIQGDDIVEIFRAFGRLATQNGVMDHLIDLSDHYTSCDHSITAYNFLKYSDMEWRKYNNALHYQNRLRFSDYRGIHEKGGFRIVGEYPVRCTEEQLDSVCLAPQFRRYDRQDLLITGGSFVSVPTQGPHSI